MQTSALIAACLLMLWLSPPLPAAAEDMEQGAPDDAVTLKPLSSTQWQKRLKGYSPDIVVVDMWATWCSSCIERFPKMVQLHRRYHERGVRFVSLCLDEHTDSAARERAKKFLQRQHAVFENYLIDENLMKAFDMLDLVGIPAVVIYDRKGTEYRRLTGDNPNRQFTDEDVETTLRELLSRDKIL